MWTLRSSVSSGRRRRQDEGVRKDKLDAQAVCGEHMSFSETRSRMVPPDIPAT
jgi:hypothetical protein